MVSEKSKIYGVDNVGQASPSLLRTDSAVGLGIVIGTTEIKSDFDRCFPWSDMQEVMDEHNNVFIKIPKFYSKITKNANGTFKHQISGCRYDGFSTLFVDGKGNELDYVLVGKYEASGSSARAYSKKGQTCLVDVTLPQMRTACKANGEGYQQYDFLIDAIIKELWLVEMATTDCQAVMKGYTSYDNSAALTTGHTDDVKSPSGSPTSNTAGTYACKYRGIENPWGNIYKWCDGINFNGTKVYICLDPEKYASDKYDNPYVYMGDRPEDSGGYLSKIEYFASFPLLGYSAEYSADGTTYYADYCYDSTYGTVLNVGGRWGGDDYAGLWYWDGDYASSDSYSVIGGRLCYKPL